MRFSYIVPVYNIKEPYFRRCIESILCQTVKDMEIIIVDDGSNSGIEKICDDYAGQYDCISVIHQANGGLSAARNAGVDHAGGDWIIHVDGDDWVDENLSESLLPYLSHPSIDILVFGYKACNDNTSRVFLLNDKKALDSDYNEIREEVLCAVLRANNTFRYVAMNTTWGKAFRREFLVNNNLTFDVKLRRAQDVIYNLYAFDCAKGIEYIDFAPCNYRIDNESLSRGYNSKTRERMRLTALSAIEFAERKKESAKIKMAKESFLASCLKIICNQDFFNESNPMPKKFRSSEFSKELSTYPFNTINFSHSSIAGYGKLERYLFKQKYFSVLYLYYKVLQAARIILNKLRG